ncbi:MAG: hypothetical protein K2P85_01725 [Flavobacteriaceae bacterium]|nr:hypothetical protein [Flavobacteriaceae bacterium]
MMIFAILFGLLPLVVFLILKKQLGEDLSPIVPFLIVVFIASVYEFLGALILKNSVEYWFLTYDTIAFFSIHYFYYTILKRKYKLFFSIFIILFICLLSLTFTGWNSKNFLELNSYFNAYQTFVVLLFSAIWFRELFVNLELASLAKSPIYYFICGLVLYYTGTLFLFLSSHLFLEIDNSTFFDYWILNIILNLVLRTLLIVGIWKARMK